METTIDYRIENGVPQFRIWFDDIRFEEVTEADFDQIMAGLDARYLGYNHFTSRSVVARNYHDYTELEFRDRMVVITREESNEVWESLYQAQLEWREIADSPAAVNWKIEGF